MRSFLFAGLRNGLSPVRGGLRESCSSLSHIYREQSVALFELETNDATASIGTAEGLVDIRVASWVWSKEGC